jgi:hypothetical protein
MRTMGIPLTRPQVLGNHTHTMTSGPTTSGDKRAMEAERMEVFVDQQVEYNVAVSDFIHMRDDDLASAHSHSRKSNV